MLSRASELHGEFECSDHFRTRVDASGDVGLSSPSNLSNGCDQ